MEAGVTSEGDPFVRNSCHETTKPMVWKCSHDLEGTRKLYSCYNLQHAGSQLIITQSIICVHHLTWQLNKFSGWLLHCNAEPTQRSPVRWSLCPEKISGEFHIRKPPLIANPGVIRGAFLYARAFLFAKYPKKFRAFGATGNIGYLVS